MNLFPEDDPDPIQQGAIKLIKPLIPPDAEERVARTVKQFNAIVREHIRSETGLRLSDEKGKGSVSLKVVDGFPDAVARLIDQHQDRTLWRLILALPRLGGIVDGLGLLISNWDEFERWPELPLIAKGSKAALDQAAEVAKVLQSLAVTKAIFEQLKKIDEDILGAYHFGGSIGPRVEIFWMAHALFAGAFGLRIEDLTVVTLAHELSHAYTHIGRDIDGVAWIEPGFGQSALAVIEGLAQFYTSAVALKLGERAPGVFPAYAKLLEHQSDSYHAHEGWLKDLATQRSETVRFAMLRARTQGKVSDENWLSMLAETRQSLDAKL